MQACADKKKRIIEGAITRPKTEIERKKRRKISLQKYATERADNVALSAKKYRLNHPERRKQIVRKWAASNLPALAVKAQNRRARKRTNGGTLSKNIAAKLFKHQRGKCACCGLPLGDDYHLDHIMPLALGGANVDSNIQLLRPSCNLQKSAKHPIDFMQSRGFLL
jgi:5-methylcytosine-specific restriction endonuclease McrA